MIDDGEANLQFTWTSFIYPKADKFYVFRCRILARRPSRNRRGSCARLLLILLRSRRTRGKQCAKAYRKDSLDYQTEL